MSPIAHNTRHANAAAEKAALHAFQLKVVRVTLLVLLGLAACAGWMWLGWNPAQIAFERLGGGTMALLAVKLVLGVLPAEVGVRILLRRILTAPSSMWILRGYWWFLGFMLATPHGVRRADTWGVDAAAACVFFAYVVGVVHGRKLALAQHEESAK